MFFFWFPNEKNAIFPQFWAWWFVVRAFFPERFPERFLHVVVCTNESIHALTQDQTPRTKK